MGNLKKKKDDKSGKMGIKD
jgi:hypothetical protein